MKLFLAAFLVFLCGGGLQPIAFAGERPNIVWIIVEDMSANFGCYGETAIATPYVDELARAGVRFTDAVVTAPVCSAARSALICGMYQTSIGAHHHRSGRGKLKIELPPAVRPVPELFREAGYHVSNISAADFSRTPQALAKSQVVAIAKTDYNFQWDESHYSRAHWSEHASSKPFFVQVQLPGGKYRGSGIGDTWPTRVEQTLGSRTTTEAVRLPPYLPPDPVIVEDWAQCLDTVRYTDWEVGRIVAALRSAGEFDNTYVFFMTDHGVSHVRKKQFCYEGGVHIPLIVRGPNIKSGTVRSDVVEHIDLAATSLALAGIDKPCWMQSQDILAEEYSPREFAFMARDRCDETVDRIRAVRSSRYKYIRNFYPQRPYLQPNRYKDGKPILRAMRRLQSQRELNVAQGLIMAQSRPHEELYDLDTDPYELNNLARDSSSIDTLNNMRDALQQWIAATGDQGESPESEAMYDSDMAAYLNSKYVSENQTLLDNIATMKKWAAEKK